MIDFVFLFIQMNDVLLYTYPQKDGKYQLKNTLVVSDMKVMLYLYHRLKLKLYTGHSVLFWFVLFPADVKEIEGVDQESEGKT